MKYEFIRLSDSFKNNSNNIYKNDNDDICLNLSELFEENNKLKYPIGIFINGILLESVFYNFENKVVTINKNYPIYPKDRIYMIMTSVSKDNSGYITQYKLNDFTVLNDDTITLVESLITDTDKEIVAVIVNGIIYYVDLFTINDGKTITFSKYRPDIQDDVSILILKK